MGGRVVDCARLESVYAARHPGFESPPIRHFLPGLSVARLAPTQDLGCLSHFDDAVSREDTAEICSRINDAVSANDRVGIQDRIASNFGTISDDRAKLPQASRNHPAASGKLARSILHLIRCRKCQPHRKALCRDQTPFASARSLRAR
jgi:hypothetical protein